jgi:copper chaperone CopZ
MTRNSSAWSTVDRHAQGPDGGNYAGGVSASPDSLPPGPSAAAGAGGPATAELAVSGMHCESCAALVEEVLVEQDGVRAASVDLAAARARIEYDSSRLGVEQLAGAVVRAGYSAAPVV